MTEQQQAKFEGWAIVELMGHQTEAGFVTTEAYGQAVMFRIDVPELPEREYTLERPEYAGGTYFEVGSKVKREGRPARSRLVSPSAVYAINPCTEETVIAALDRNTHRPLILIEAPKKKELPPPEKDAGDPIAAHFQEQDQEEVPWE